LALLSTLPHVMQQTLKGREVVYPARVPSPDHILVRNTHTGERLRVENAATSAENMWVITLQDEQPPGTQVTVTHCMLDTPDDAITLESEGHNMLVVVVAGPGAQFTVEDVVGANGAGPHPLVTAAISNPPSASGAVQCYLSLPSFATCMRERMPMLRTQMPGICVFPWRREARSEEAQAYLANVAGLIAMQLICGVTTLPSTRGLDVFPAIAFTLAADGNMQAALALAPYYAVLAERQKRGEHTVLEWVLKHCSVWNAIALSNAEDGNHAISNVPLSLMCTAFGVACAGGSYPSRMAPAVFETARLGLDQQSRSDLRDVQKKIVAPLTLCARMRRAEDIPAATVLAWLVPHLVDPNAETAKLHLLVRSACRLVLAEPFELTDDHPSVAAAQAFLWELAETELARPVPTLQRPRETWTLLISVMHQLAALLGPSTVDAVVAAANDNSGWLRKAHLDAMTRDAALVVGEQASDVLRLVLSPTEMVWLALVLCKTQGNTARIRELGPLTVRDNLVIDAEFVETWARDGDEAVAQLNMDAVRSFYVDLVGEALRQVMDSQIRLRPDVLFGLTKMALRGTHTDLALRMMDALSRMRAISSRANLTERFLCCLPGDLISSNRAALVCVLRVLNAACTKPVPGTAAATINKDLAEIKQVLQHVPKAILQLVDVQQVFLQRGVPRHEIEALLGNPGVTTCIPGSRRFSARLVKLLRACAGPSWSEHIDGTQFCLSMSACQEADHTVVLVPPHMVRGTIFDRPHNAARVYFHPQRRGGDLVPYRVEFDAADTQVRDDDGHWAEEWTSAMFEWRGEVLGDTPADRAAREAAKQAAKANAPAGASASAAAAPTMEELEEIVVSVEHALGQLRAPQVEDWDADDDGE